MKQNGRMRWRKFVRYERANSRGTDFLWRVRPDGWEYDQLVHYYGPAVPLRASVGFARRHRAAICPTLKPLPAKPFSVRSLVGRSQANRKKLARLSTLSGQPSRSSRQSERYALLLFRDNYFSWSANGKARYIEDRKPFRIGHRLRPCPGKHGCLNCTRTCGACEDQAPDDTKCARCGSVMTTEGPLCDGSGVVNAGPSSQRKAWVNGRPRIVLSPWLSIDNYSAMRVIVGTDPAVIANRRAFVEKTPQIFDGKEWIQGPKGSGGAPPFDRNEEYGFYPPSRRWCDEKLIAMGYVLTEEVADAG